MERQRARSHMRLVIVEVFVVTVIIAATLFAALGTGSTVTRTTIRTGGRVYDVTFQQVRYCGRYNILPWAVTLNGQTEVQPPNQSLPLPNDTFSTIVPDQSLTRITFSVPSGTYNYAVSGGSQGPGGQLYPGGGTIQVNGSDVLVNLDVYLSFTCMSTTTT